MRLSTSAAATQYGRLILACASVAGADFSARGSQIIGMTHGATGQVIDATLSARSPVSSRSM